MREWINGLVKSRYKTVAALAKAIGMTESGFSRAMKAGTFEAENCLLLAYETGAAPGDVLTMAGKAQLHQLIEKLYGKARPEMAPDVAKACDLMSKIEDPQAREGFLMMMRGYLTQQAAASGRAHPRQATHHR
jgi:hypothetical protein